MTFGSELDLGREPLLRDIQLPGGVVVRLWQGRTNAAGVGLELSQLELSQTPTPTRLRQAWAARRAGNPRPVIVFAEVDEQVLLCGPDGNPPLVASLPRPLAEQIFAQVLDESPVRATLRALTLLARAQGSGNVPGFRNRNLVSTHYVTNVIRRENRPEWTEAADAGDRALGQVGESLVRALGYGLVPIGHREFQVRDGDVTVAILHLYDETVSLDRVGVGQSAPPAAIALKRARELGLDHALLVAGSLLRVYTIQPEEALDESAASAAFVEFDTTLLPRQWAPLLGALAAPDALRANGRLERLRQESGRYAVALRERFTERRDVRNRQCSIRRFGFRARRHSATGDSKSRSRWTPKDGLTTS